MTAFIGKHGLDVIALADAAQGDSRVARGIDGRLYRYADGVYIPDGEDYLRAQCQALLGGDFKRRHVEEVIGWFRSALPTIGETPSLNVLNVANGLLDLKTGRLRPHDPDFMSTIQIPVAWNPKAKAPRFEQFLTETLPGSEEIACEILGYELYPSGKFQTAVLLQGGGDNGKSKFLFVCRSLLGRTNYSAVTLHSLIENRFASAELFGKLANISGDLDARSIKRTDTFKMLTGEDSIMAERKNGHPFTFVSFALPLFSANEPPLTSDQTHAYFRRWIILPFNRKFVRGIDADVNLEDKLAAEIEGILVLAVKGLRRLLKRGRFDLPEPVQAAKDEYEMRLDSVKTFIAEVCTVGPDRWIVKSSLYRVYRDWAKEQGRPPMSAPMFNQRLKEHLGDAVDGTRQKRVDGRNVGLVWRGIQPASGGHR